MRNRTASVIITCVVTWAGCTNMLPTPNELPEVGDIPDQAILPGSQFSEIDLKQFITDNNHAIEDIKWFILGEDYIHIEIVNHIATIQIIDSFWLGRDTVVFVAQDPRGGQDKDAAVFTVIDTIGPVATSFFINNDAQIANSLTVEINLAGTDNLQLYQMMISEDAGFVGATWGPYNRISDWTFSGPDGVQVLYAKVNDSFENESVPLSDEIYLITEQIATTFSVDTLKLGVGERAKVSVLVLNPMGLVSGRLILRFDPEKIKVTELVMQALPDQIFLSSGAFIIESDHVIDNDSGKVVLGALAKLEEFTGVTQDGPFAELTIEAIATNPTSQILIFSAEYYTHPLGNPPIPQGNFIGRPLIISRHE